MPTTRPTVTVNQDQLMIALNGLKLAAGDRDGMLRPIGELMRTSIARTFREEGSPAGSWPELAASTLKKKGYQSGVRLLIRTGRLFNSMTYWVQDGTLTVGTNVVYAAVQNYGSADRRGGSVGAQAKIPSRAVAVAAYQYAYNYVQRKRGKDGKLRKKRGGTAETRVASVSGHARHQNIPARPFLVIRPEDPARFASSIQRYLRSRSRAITP